MSEVPAVIQIDTQPATAQEEATQANKLLVYVKTLAIASHEDRLAIGEFRKQIKARINALEAKRKEHKEPILKAGKMIDALFNTPKDTYESADRHVATMIGTWDAEQERLRRIEEARLRAIVEAENAKLLAAAAKKAEKLEAKGQPEQAAAVRDVAQASLVTTPVVATTIPKVEGEHYRTTYHWRCKECQRQDCAHLRKVLPNEYLTPDIKEINAVVERRKQDTDLPGVEIYTTKTLVSRTR